MNYSTAIFLVNKDVRAVAISYERDANGKGVAPFEVFKSMDPDIIVGEMVVVPTSTRHQMTVVRVEEVRDGSTVDLDSGVQMQWVVDRVSVDPYETILEQEAAGIEQIKSAELRRRREELRDKLLADNPDLQALSGVNPDATPALPAPAAV